MPEYSQPCQDVQCQNAERMDDLCEHCQAEIAEHDEAITDEMNDVLEEITPFLDVIPQPKSCSFFAPLRRWNGAWTDRCGYCGKLERFHEEVSA